MRIFADRHNRRLFLTVAAGIKAPIKRLNEMSVTETIGQL